MMNARRPRAASWAAFSATVLALLLAACAGATPSPIATPSASAQYPGWPGSGSVIANPNFVPILVSAETGTGHSRMLVTIEDAALRSLASPDLSVSESFYDLAASVDNPTTQVDGTFHWLIPDSKGIYVSYADFPHAGDWGLEVTASAAGEPDRTGRVTFSVRETTSTPAIGADAPPSDTLTATDAAAISAISTDEDPDPAFYSLSILDAIAAGKPFVVVFATPALCTSGVCGPALDQAAQEDGREAGERQVDSYRERKSGQPGDHRA